MSVKEKLKLTQDTPGRYHFRTKDDQIVNIEHRDGRLVLRLSKWDGKASFEVDLNMVKSNDHQFKGNEVRLETSKLKLRAYPIDTRSTAELYGDNNDDTQCEDGGIRFELVLKEKPLNNSFTVPIKSRNLRFSCQPFLTEQDIANGISCPLNVEGSYAVYHATKKNNQYMTGKAFHIYRPIAEDALGNKAWCTLYIDKHIDPMSLTITVPQQFIDGASYPITIDPDFGYSVIGGTWYQLASDGSNNSRCGGAWAMPAPGGTVNYIRARIGAQVGTPTVDCKVFINEKDSGGVGNHGQIAGPVENLECAAAEHWEEFTFADEALTEAAVYILNILGNIADTVKGEAYSIRYDNNGAVASYDEIQNYAAPESPWVVAADGTTRDHSIYCNYTDLPAGWTGKIAGVTNPAKIMGVDVANIEKVKGVASA